MKANDMRIARGAIGGGLVAAILALSACGGGKSAPQSPPPAKVGVVTLKAQPVTITTELPGRTVAYRVAEIRPQVSGIIQKRLFVEGSEVKQGQQLYQIDPALYQAAYDSAAALAKSSKAQAERYKPLAEAQAVSQQQYDDAIAAARQNAASAETARINLIYTRLLSPISGRIGRSSVTEGALVTANQSTALATVQQLDPIYVDVTQPSSVLLRLRRELADGQLKRAGENQAQVHLTLEDGSDYAPTGKLLFSEYSVDETTGSVTLRAQFPNPDGVLLPGMFVHERIDEGEQQNALLVPQMGVTHDQKGEPTAMVVNADNKVELRQLHTERAIGDQWLVSSGLKPGDRVIVDGLQFVRPGATVQASEYQPPGASPATPQGKPDAAQTPSS